MVDDEADVRRFLQLILEGSGYAVDSAGDGQEALDKIEVDRPDVVVLDP